MSFINIIHFIILFYNYYGKNIVLPIKKISIENFNGKGRTINDLLSFFIYTNITMGTPPHPCAHIIEQKQDIFLYKKIELSYNSKKYDKDLEQKIINTTNFWYITDNSTTFNLIDGYYMIYSDIFYFQNLNNNQTKIELKFNIYTSQNKYKCGIISLKNPVYPYFGLEMYFINEIKEKDLISEYYFTFIYNENNSLFNYNNDLNLGKIIIGESPHIFDPDKYKKDDEIINNGNEFTLFINQMKFNTSKFNYSEENFKLELSFTSGFIKGSSSFRDEIKKIFFEELFKKNLCSEEYLEENLYIATHIVYSCNNTKEVQEQIKSFPTLYFEIKQNNLTFIFTYKELFSLFNEKIYFLINFKDGNYTDWKMGDIFLRKYLTSFNYDAKTISFYKNQVDEINSKSKVPDFTENKDDNTSKVEIGKIIRIIVEIVMGIIIIVISVLLYKKYKSSRKKRANELNDDEDYDYTPKEKKEPILTENENNSNNLLIN